MAKQVTNVERETVQPHPHALEKEVVTLECDDGSEYIFELTDGNAGEKFRLARRVKPDGEVSTSSAILPAAVEETMDAAIERWSDLGLDGSGWFK